MNKNRVKQIIEETSFCLREEIKNLSPMKTGMTNNSYSFFMKGKRYIIRIPGKGTEQLINRQFEYDVYKAIDHLDISERVCFFDPETGIKISSFLENTYACNPDDFNNIQECMKELRRFHNQGIVVSHKFDLLERILYYESLLEGQMSCYSDYEEVKSAVLELFSFVKEQPCEWTLCHIDAVPDNFLFEECEGNKRVRLIDWEYAGMQDPHLDIAMFAVYAMFDRANVDRLIDAYFTEGCSDLVRIKIYCYIAISGLLWSNWCEFKRKNGVEFGNYAQRQYDYAKEYTAYYKSEIQRLKNGTQIDIT